MLSINYIKPNRDPLMQCNTIVLERTLFYSPVANANACKIIPKNVSGL